MGTIKRPDPVKAIIGVLYAEEEIYETVLSKIEAQFDQVDYQSEPFPFVETDYYADEMGSNLVRRFISLNALIFPDELIHLKQMTNLFEEQLSEDGNRRINLDPGYLDSAKLVLASAKNFSHRLYLGRGIYGEVTMRFQEGQFSELPWTYPDYLHHREVFHHLRDHFKLQLKAHGSHEEIN